MKKQMDNVSFSIGDIIATKFRSQPYHYLLLKRKCKRYNSQLMDEEPCWEACFLGPSKFGTYHKNLFKIYVLFDRHLHTYTKIA